MIRLPPRSTRPDTRFPCMTRFRSVAHMLLNRTVFGSQVLAIGMNRKAAEISGVRVRRIIIAVFVLSAICAMIGGLLFAARLEAGRPTLGGGRSEEHTSELQSLMRSSYGVFCLKKKQKI